MAPRRDLGAWATRSIALRMEAIAIRVEAPSFPPSLLPSFPPSLLPSFPPCLSSLPSSLWPLSLSLKRDVTCSLRFSAKNFFATARLEGTSVLVLIVALYVGQFIRVKTGELDS